MPIFDHGGSVSVFPTGAAARSGRSQGSIRLLPPAAFPSSAALCEGFPEKYSLFLNGLSDHNMIGFSLQVVLGLQIVFVLFFILSDENAAGKHKYAENSSPQIQRSKWIFLVP